MKIIAVAGYAGSGKGAVGDLLQTQYKFRRVAFADKVKDSVAVIFGWPRDMLEGDTLASRNFREQTDPAWSARLGFDVTPRWALQRMGTEAGRNGLHKDIWVQATDAAITDMDDGTVPGVVITDMRFPNEIDYALSNPDAEIWYVSRHRDIVQNDSITDHAYQTLWIMANKAAMQSFVKPMSDADTEALAGLIGQHPSEWSWFRHPAIASIGTKYQNPRVKHILNDGTLAQLADRVSSAFDGHS